jgi:hypothetical protein
VGYLPPLHHTRYPLASKFGVFWNMCDRTPIEIAPLLAGNPARYYRKNSVGWRVADTGFPLSICHVRATNPSPKCRNRHGNLHHFDNYRVAATRVKTADATSGRAMVVSQ